MQVVIETGNSALILHSLDAEAYEWIEKSIPYIESLLVVNPPIYMWGKECTQHRSIGFFTNGNGGYNYSSSKTPAIPLNEEMGELLEWMNARFDSNFNGILVNKYKDGNDYIGKHSDDMRGVDESCGVICISYGACRKFRVREKPSGQIVKDLITNSSQMIQMKGKFQEEFTHEIPMEKKVREARYSFTFRSHR
jgi:alkylated DNA repair dioxygenase AlkB